MRIIVELRGKGASMAPICDGRHMGCSFYKQGGQIKKGRRDVGPSHHGGYYWEMNSYSCSMKAAARSLRAACTTVVGCT